MRVLHIIDSLDYTGSASQLLVLSQALRERGIDVHVCALDRWAPRREEFVAAGIATHVVPRRWRLDPMADLQLARHVRRLRPDVVHTWDTVPGMFGPITSGRKLVTGHYRIDRYKPGWEWAIERRFGKRAARFVTNSEAVREWLTQHGLPEEKFATIPSGLPPARPSDVSRAKLLCELGLPADAKLIGVVGKLVPEKRTKDLIWAADLLRVLHDNLRVLVIGDGMLRAQLEEYARLASDLDHIRFLGQGGDLWRIMPHLDVLWNGGENVGQSSAIMEAMAAGVPVIASDTPVNRELVVNSETGYLIPPGTRAGRAARARLTDQIFTDRQQAKQLAAAALARTLRSFAVEQSVQRHLEIYEAT